MISASVFKLKTEHEKLKGMNRLCGMDRSKFYRCNAAIKMDTIN